MLGGKTQGKSAPRGRAEGPSFDDCRLGNDICRQRSSPCPYFKRKALAWENTAEQRSGDACWKGMIQVSKEKGGHTTKT